MKNFKTLKTIFIAVLLIASFTACSDDDNDDPEVISYKTNIINIANTVYVETYTDLADKTSTLFNESVDLKNTPTTDNLIATRNAWITTRSPWEQSEGFLIGPAGDTGLGTDGAIDSWPVNVVDMDALLNDTVNFPTITASIIEAQTDTAKGLHLAEYLLWGVNSDKVIGDFTTREFEYLSAVCENLKDRTVTLKEEWQSSGGNYVGNFINAGNSSTENDNFISEKSTLEFMIDALIVIADEVANKKIEEPLNGTDGGGVDPTVEESRFSNNSKIDFANNVRSIQNVYLGRFSGNNGSGLGLTQIVASIDSTLDTRFKQEIQDAIDAIDAIPGTFTDAIINNRATVENAQEKVRVVQETLEETNGIKATLGSL